MADYATSLAFAIPATRTDALRFVMLIEATTTIEESGAATLPPDIEDAFADMPSSGAQIIAAIFKDETGFGIDCLFDEEAQTLTIYDNNGSPALWPLAQCIQRLFPAKLPIGFVYANTCSKHRPNGFGGGLFAIGTDCIVHKTLDQALADALEDLKGTSDDT